MSTLSSTQPLATKRPPSRQSIPRSLAAPASRRAIFSGVTMAPANVVEALAALETVAARLRERNDPRAVFPDVYAVITRRVRDAIVHGQRFLEPAWISRLAGIFCEHYLNALAASLDGRACEADAWNVAFECSGARGTAAAVHALLGINAHINFDLALGLYENIVRHGAAADARLLRRYRHDHDLVNEILSAAMPEIFEILARRYACPLARVATLTPDVQRAVSKAVMFSLRRWRDRVWDDLLDLLAAESSAGRAAVLARMNQRSATVARALETGNGALRVSRPLFQSALRSFAQAA
jgi:hypothetical protein